MPAMRPRRRDQSRLFPMNKLDDIKRLGSTDSIIIAECFNENFIDGLMVPINQRRDRVLLPIFF